MPIELLQIGVPTKLIDNVAVGVGVTSAVFATPKRCPRFTAGTVFSVAPGGVTILIEGSMDQVVWQTLATFNNTAGENSGLVSNAAPFTRARMTAVAGGANFTVWIEYKDNL